MGWKQSIAINIIIIVILLPVACGEIMTAEELFDFLDTKKTITDITEIEYIESDWTPNKTWQTVDNTNAWIDIVGYIYSVKKDNIFYTNQSQEEAASVMYGISDNIDTWNWGVESLEGEIVNRTYNSSCVTVTLETTLEYYHLKVICVDTCRIVKTDYTDIEYFTDTDCNPPEIYPAVNVSENCTVNVYNNSYAPKIIVDIPYSNYMLGYHVEYLNETADLYYNVMDVDHLETGYPYGNLTSQVTQDIFEDSEIFTRLGDNIIIRSGSINDTIYISALSPYTEQQINYTIVNHSDDIKVDKHMISTVFSSILLILICIFLFKYYGR